MSITKSQTEKIGPIFKGNKFVVPIYQRKYSWTDKERKALWDDIEESIAYRMNHFLGTLVFEEKTAKGLSTDTVYEIIDGQQRLSTIYILLHTLIEKIKDKTIKDDLTKEFIGTIETKVRLSGEDKDYFDNLILNYNKVKTTTHVKRSQKRLFNAKQQFKALVDALNDDEIAERIMYIRDNIEVLVFNVESQVQAIKMFSIINDRGLPLSILDKTKSILMLFSSLKLNSSLNDDINNSFKNIFDAYDDILEDIEKLNILGRFDEITLFTSHYYSAKQYFTSVWNIRDGTDKIFDNIKTICDEYKDSPLELENFISSYTKDLENYCVGFSNLIKALSKKKRYLKPFIYLEFSAILYPLLVRLFLQDKLDNLLNIIEATELRVYKVNNTNPIADIYRLSSDIAEHSLSIDDIMQRLRDFNNSFMSDYTFRTILSGNIYRNNSVKYILLEHNSETIKVDKYRDLQIEHIFSANPNFEVSKYGFSDDYDYEKNRLGNLTLLKTADQPRAKNDPPINKVSIYLSSGIRETMRLAGKIQKGNYNKNNVDERRDEIINYCLKRFKIG